MAAFEYVERHFRTFLTPEQRGNRHLVRILGIIGPGNVARIISNPTTPLESIHNQGVVALRMFILKTYKDDRDLRGLLFDILQTIEVDFLNRICRRMRRVTKKDKFWHLDPTCFDNHYRKEHQDIVVNRRPIDTVLQQNSAKTGSDRYERNLKTLARLTNRNATKRNQKREDKNDRKQLPWHSTANAKPSTSEILDQYSFGELIHLYSMLDLQCQNDIARRFDLDQRQFFNWMLALLHLRNHIAHNHMLYDNYIRFSPAGVPKTLQNAGISFGPTRYLWPRIVILSYFLRKLQVPFHVQKSLMVQLKKMGFPLLMRYGFPGNWSDILENVNALPRNHHTSGRS